MTSTRRGDWLRYALATFVVGVVLNYIWEVSQVVLYVGMDSIPAIWWHYFVAALGDGVILLTIHATGCLVFGKPGWFVHPRAAQIVFLLGFGLAIAVAVEWAAVYWLHRWSYTSQMPLIPGLGIGVTPVLQMLVLPAAIFQIANKWFAYPGVAKVDSPNWPGSFRTCARSYG